MLECRTSGEHAATFFLAEDGKRPGEDEPFSWGQGALWVPTVEDGLNLVQAVRKAFPSEYEDFESPRGVAPPLVLGLAVFAAVPRWTKSKWSTDEGIEFFANWSLGKQAGYFSEKDEAFREGVDALMASLLLR